MHFFTEAFALFMAFVLYWMNGPRRRYLKRRIGKQSVKNVYRVARNVGYMLCRPDVELHGFNKNLTQGAILYSFHFGIWETMPRAIRKLGCDIGVLVNKYTEASSSVFSYYIDRLLEYFRANGGVSVFTRYDTIKIVQFLKRGGILGVLVDGNDFYAKFPKIQKLGKICDVPLVPFAAYRRHGRSVVEIGCDLDQLIADQPLDYVWFYRSRTA
jgi:lauroyl/myristoyl acyltransferase